MALATIGKITAILQMTHLTDTEKVKRISDKISKFDGELNKPVEDVE
jgi:hypothetical protein